MDFGTLVALKLIIVVTWWTAIAVGRSTMKQEMKQHTQQPPIERVEK
jgi:hypothetical protein